MKKAYCRPNTRCIKLNASHNLMEISGGNIDIGGKGDFDVKEEFFDTSSFCWDSEDD